MTHIYTYKFRIYPNKKQKQELQEHFNNCQFAYNKVLEQIIKNKKKAKSLTWFDLCKILTSVKKKHDFLYKTNSQSLQLSIKSLKQSIDSGKFKYKSAQSQQTLHIPQRFEINNQSKKGYISVPGVSGQIKTIFHRNIEGKIKNIIITKKPSGNYFVSIVSEKENRKNTKKNKKIIGIDMGIKDLAITYDGENIEKIDNPKLLQKYIKKIKKIHRKMSKKKHNSKNYYKLKKKLCKLYEKYTNKKRDYYNKITNEITNNYETIVIEKLRTTELQKGKNKKYRQNLYDVSWYLFTTQLKYKGSWKNANIIELNKYFPSSKICHVCNHKKEKLSLNERIWTCDNCGTQHDRDINAAINIYKEGMHKINS